MRRVLVWGYAVLIFDYISWSWIRSFWRSETLAACSCLACTQRISVLNSSGCWTSDRCPLWFGRCHSSLYKSNVGIEKYNTCFIFNYPIKIWPLAKVLLEFLVPNFRGRLLNAIISIGIFAFPEWRTRRIMHLICITTLAGAVFRLFGKAYFTRYSIISITTHSLIFGATKPIRDGRLGMMVLG